MKVMASKNEATKKAVTDLFVSTWLHRNFYATNDVINLRNRIANGYKNIKKMSVDWHCVSCYLTFQYMSIETKKTNLNIWGQTKDIFRLKTPIFF